MLIVTRSVSGTATNIAQERRELFCSEPEGHSGPHRDERQREEWEDKGAELTHVLRHDDET